MDRPGESGDSGCWDCDPLGEGGCVIVVELFGGDRGVVVVRAVGSVPVVPVDPFQGGDLDVVEVPPRSAVVDPFGLVQPNRALGQGVDAPIAVKQL